MPRYQPRQVVGAWSILDQQTHETIDVSEAGGSRAGAAALAELLNSLEAQQHWRREAARWPQRTGGAG